MSSAPPTRRIASLDGLRTLSVGFVLCGHLYGTANYPRNQVTAYFTHLSYVGVEIFFVISGFLITTLLLKERERTGTVDMVYFYLRRTLRIFPAAFCFITVMAIAVHPGYLTYAYTYMMCYSDEARPWVLSHLWSLSVEEQFYLLWPVALIFGYRWRWFIGLGVLLAAIAARLYYWHAGMEDATVFAFPAVADDLMMGCLLAFSVGYLRRRASWLRHPVVFILLAALVLASPQLGPHIRLSLLFRGVVPFTIALFIFAAIERADGFLNNVVTNYVGLLSYSIYLWQQPFLNRSSHAWWASFPTNLGLAFACAVTSYYLVEKPFLGMFRHPGRSSVHAPASRVQA